MEEFSVLDVGAGTGQLLGVIAEFARKGRRRARLIGLDLNPLAVREIASESSKYDEISAIQGDALGLPFADNAFDYAFCSLFTHHLNDEQIPAALAEMSRVARRGVFVIDLERSRVASYLYKLFCFAFRISPLVTQDGALSVRKGFTKSELLAFSRTAFCQRSFPFRLVLSLPASRPSSDG